MLEKATKFESKKAWRLTAYKKINYLHGTSHNILSKSNGEVSSEPSCIWIKIFAFRQLRFTMTCNVYILLYVILKNMHLFNGNIRIGSCIMVGNQATRTVNSSALVNQHVTSLWVYVIGNYKALWKMYWKWNVSIYIYIYM